MVRLDRLVAICILMGIAYGVVGQNMQSFVVADSSFVERSIKQFENVDSVSLIDVASLFVGVPYLAGTLEHEEGERLVVNTRQVDCTTFVEQVVALWRTLQYPQPSFALFVDELRLMRYRSGKVDGYLSRLHYFTDWVTENAKRGVWRELAPADADRHLWSNYRLALSFMSRNPGNYPVLKKEDMGRLREIEGRYDGLGVNYIDKSYLHLSPDELPVCDGDILSMVTSIDGLDVTHLGFAVWRDGKLHLLHASMTHNCVVLDERTLYDYLKNRTSCPGVRVLRVWK